MWALMALVVSCAALAAAQDGRCLDCICQVRK